MVADLEMAWGPVCHPPKDNQLQGVKVPLLPLFLPKSLLDTIRGDISEGKSVLLEDRLVHKLFESLLNIVLREL